MPAEPRALPFKKNKFSLVYDKNGQVVQYLRFHNPTGFYYVRKTFKRYRIPELFEPLGVTTIGKAKAAADAKITEHLNKWLGEKRGLEAKRFQATTIGKVIDNILEVYTPTKRARTKLQHNLYLGELKKEWGGLDVSRFSVAVWKKWLEEFRRRKDRETYNDYRKHMNLTMRFAYENGYVSSLITLPNPDGERKPRYRVLSQAEIGALYEAMGEDTRDQFVLAYECYMRLSEGLLLTWDRVNLETGEIVLRAEDVKTGSKTGKGRTFIASANALSRLRARRERAGQASPFVFPSPHNHAAPVRRNSTAWSAAKRRAKLKGEARWHDVRHTAITHALLVHKVEPILVSEYAGVSMATIQRVYLHSSADRTKSAGEALRIS